MPKNLEPYVEILPDEEDPSKKKENIRIAVERDMHTLNGNIPKVDNTDPVDSALFKGLKGKNIQIGSSPLGKSNSTIIVKAILQALQDDKPDLEYIQALCDRKGWLGLKSLNRGTTIGGVDLSSKRLTSDDIEIMKKSISPTPAKPRDYTRETVYGNLPSPHTPVVPHNPSSHKGR
jgi:hypothetical protein